MTDVVLIHLAEHAIPAGPDSSRCFMSDLGNLAPDSKPVAHRGSDRIDLDDILPGLELTAQQVFETLKVR